MSLLNSLFEQSQAGVPNCLCNLLATHNCAYVFKKKLINKPSQYLLTKQVLHEKQINIGIRKSLSLRSILTVNITCFHTEFKELSIFLDQNILVFVNSGKVQINSPAYIRARNEIAKRCERKSLLFQFPRLAPWFSYGQCMKCFGIGISNNLSKPNSALIL